MKKIQKNPILATAYKRWLDGLNASGKNHPTYTSSFRFYKDVVANLLWVQKGLCAYTEMYLMDANCVNPNEWSKGRIKDFDFLGHLDHYDSSLKTDKGWEWNNFFVVHSDVNVKAKRAKKVNNILKPDAAVYDPFYYLSYDFKTHHFYPNGDRAFAEQKKILEDINTLGLNYQPIIDYRKKDLKPIIDDVLLGHLTIKKGRERLNQFYTAFEMSLQSLGYDINA